MWQRIQTVFLVITIIALLVAMVQPIWQAQEGDTRIILTPFYLLKGSEYIYLPYTITAVLAVAAITLAILEIRRYDNRQTQIKLGALNTLILACYMISAVWFASQLTEQYPLNFNYGIGLYLTFVAVICNWLAIRFIRRDERIVQESNRLR
jgi:heme/copper-type cytochrome/quinol oxidase subunit 3